MSVVITDPYDLLQDRFCHMMNFDGFHDLGTVHKAMVRSTLLRGATCQKTGVLHFVFLVTLCHKSSCVKCKSNS